MRLLRAILPVVLAAGAALGQDSKPAVAEATPDYDAVIIPVKTLTGDSFNRLVKLLDVFHARMQSDDKLRTIVVYAPRDVVDKMRKVVHKKLPPAPIEGGANEIRIESPLEPDVVIVLIGG